MARNKNGLEEALRKIPDLRERFWREVRVPGDGEDFNQALERAGRVADFLEFAELMCRDTSTPRFFGIRGVDVSRRPRPRRILWRAFPRRTSNVRRRGIARR